MRVSEHSPAGCPPRPSSLPGAVRPEVACVPWGQTEVACVPWSQTERDGWGGEGVMGWRGCAPCAVYSLVGRWPCSRAPPAGARVPARCPPPGRCQAVAVGGWCEGCYRSRELHDAWSSTSASTHPLVARPFRAGCVPVPLPLVLVPLVTGLLLGAVSLWRGGVV